MEGRTSLCSAIRWPGVAESTRDAQGKTMEGNRGSRSPGRAGVRRLAIGMTMTAVVAVALSGALAVSPQLLGQYFTLFEEFAPDGSVLYRVEARVIGITPTGVKTADVDVQVRVTNHHDFAVEVLIAHFEIVDLQKRRLTLLFSLDPVTIPANTVKDDILSTAEVIKVLGVGNRYLVTGSVTWNEIHVDPVLGVVVRGPFTELFEEVHTVMEFTR